MSTDPDEYPSYGSEDESTWRPAKVEISGIEGTFDGEIGPVLPCSLPRRLRIR